MIKFEDVNFKTLKPPTYFKTNSFTFPFHEIINTYGVPTYKEFNPAFYTYITFPFLFGVMFGDIGHGFLLFFIASILCLFEPCLHGYSSLHLFLKIRYLLLLMGLFSVFCGFIYNEFVSLPLTFVPSCYNYKTGIKIHENCVYKFGIDPIWYISRNELTYINSLKMKLSVIIGVI
jgi:V-type H+-transporting ATPase subunit a